MRLKVITPEKLLELGSRKEEIIIAYQKEHNIVKCAKIFGVSKGVFTQFLKNNHIPLSKNKTTPEKIQELYARKDEIISIYRQDYNIRRCAKRFLVSRQTLYKFLKDNNVVTDRKYPLIDELFLEKIDEAWKAYYLGFFCADGCVNRDILTLAIKDRDILEKINKKIHLNKPLTHSIDKYTTYYKGRKIIPSDRFILRVCHKEVTKKIKELGISERKSLTLEFPKIFENSEFLGAFIRGYFDGDGCITTRPQKQVGKFTYRVSLCVSFPFGRKLQELLKNNSIKSQLKSSDSEIHILLIHDINSLLKFYKLIYGDNSDFFLERKKKIFDEFYKYHPTLKQEKRSKHKGVYFCKHRGLWVSRYCLKGESGKSKFVGYYATEADCLAGYQEYAKKIEENNYQQTQKSL